MSQLSTLQVPELTFVMNIMKNHIKIIVFKKLYEISNALFNKIHIKIQISLKINMFFLLFLLPLQILCKSTHFISKSSEKPPNSSLNQKIFHFALNRSKSSAYDKDLKNLDDVEYQTELILGSNFKTFYVVIDTGSADLYVPSSNNKECVKQKKKEKNIALFNCSRSKTCQTTGVTISLEYDDGSVFTEEVRDSVYITDELTLKNQSFLLDYKQIGNFDCYGIWGLGFPSLSSSNNPGIIQALLKNGEIDNYVFGLYLTSNDSKLIIGGIDYSLLNNSNEIAYFPFVDDDSYSVSFDSLTFNDKVMNLYGVNMAVADSGNSEFTIPRIITDQIIYYLKDDLNISCFYVVEESSPEYSMIYCVIGLNSLKFPEIKLGLNGQNIVFEPEDYISDCEAFSNASILCKTNLEMSSIDSEIILGDAILQSFYCIFDLENNTLGLSRNNIERTIKFVNETKAKVRVSNNLETSNTETTTQKKYDWTVYATISGFFMLLPLVYLSSILMRRKSWIDEGQSSTILGVGFMIIIVGINIYISVI